MKIHPKFHIQIRHYDGVTWYEPREWHTGTQHDGLVLHADTITELRNTLYAISDERTDKSAVYYRIITTDGTVIEKYKIKPGVMTKTRSKQ